MLTSGFGLLHVCGLSRVPNPATGRMMSTVASTHVVEIELAVEPVTTGVYNLPPAATVVAESRRDSNLCLIFLA
jgi:hypothetical protein